MIDLDVRVALVMVFVAATTVAAPLALGGALAIGGVIAAVLAARSVVRSDEGSVSTAIIAGGLLTAATLSRGHAAALLTVAGVFVGAELAAFGRRLAVDPEAPSGPELKITAMTIGIGVAAGGVLAVVARWHVAPPLANIALVLLLAATAITLARARLGPRADD